jgi:two-component system, OmpR family, alkaline phosphatase synthesis response regulator PhoP
VCPEEDRPHSPAIVIRESRGYETFTFLTKPLPIFNGFCLKSVRQSYLEPNGTAVTSTAGRILIVDDEFDFAEGLAQVVSAAGHCPEIARDGNSAIHRATSTTFDLIVLDMNLPDLDGCAVCRALRDSSIDTPVLVLSGASDTSQKVRALESGADDFVGKPFVIEELLARIAALLRRYRTMRHAVIEYRIGPAHVDFLSATVTRSGVPVGCSTKEIQLLRFLIERRNCVVSRETLLKDVWGYVSTDTRTVDVHIAGIRQKVEDNPEQPRFIVTVRGKGYMFRD